MYNYKVVIEKKNFFFFFKFKKVGSFFFYVICNKLKYLQYFIYLKLNKKIIENGFYF